ncbi:ArnT family glycosyltransferase [Subtercola lobariae]|uniref:Glycosyltransferase RgtA/B/C/D-like domain-containing protein n=1 Tax=Subtercola lobariae TaxID=1588641 RepID=A0A917BFP4_9MICO|nr:glycosyltransferase family 39 protein [Subtercola lobariae]GGF41469.1 hypothetical protein GCM10011399_37690 [Subtercola lobariae]
MVNITGAPQRIDDEGTYTAQAWAIDRLGSLTHYTYWYDHPPLGWIQIALYARLTNAFGRYDYAVFAAREFMVVVTMVSAVLLWMLARKLRLGRASATIAVLLFTVSPLALQFHRSVYLDNIAAMWMLAAFVLAFEKRHQLASFVGSAACFGIAVLSKETFLLALPLLAWLLWRNAHPSTRRYTLAVAATVLIVLGAAYVLLAAVKGEVFPAANRVSLFNGLTFQLSSRASSGSITDPTSLINKTFSMWWQLDPVGIVGAVCAGLGALFIKRLRAFAIMFLVLVAFMFRPGGYLPVPYVIILLPFGALLIGAVIDSAARVVYRKKPATSRRRLFGALVVLMSLVAATIAGPLWVAQLRGFFSADLDAPMRQAEAYTEANVPHDARLIVDDSMWVDLVTAGFARDNVTWYYKVDTDPAVEALSPNGWRDSDYIITTDSMRSLLSTSPDVNDAVQNSVVVASFGQGDALVEVRQIEPQGATQAQADATASTKARASAGAQLAENANLTMPLATRDLLTGGQVDARVILTLSELLSTSTVTVGDYPLVDGEGDDTRRQILITSLNGDQISSNPAAAAAAQAYFQGLTGMVKPAQISLTPAGLLVTFALGEPSGLLTPTP